MKKLLFFDIDGTLWDYNNYIPESTVKALRLARENGHLIFMNSGRSRAFIREENLLSLNFDGIISGCGTMIEYNGRTIFYRNFEQEEVERIISISSGHGIKLILEGSRYIYANVEEYAGDPNDGYYVEKIARELQEDLKPIASGMQYDIQKFSCSIFGCDTDSYMKEIGDEYYSIIHNNVVMEVVPKGFSKGTGIKEVCELLGADISDTYAFGDSINDREMLIDAGTAIVMGNGTAAAKEYADHVTTDLLEDGIMNALKHYELI
ncbi:MAG: Cof-type HAD-IIB family hydrolase [Lachnospiraceae bacterium]|nr:Cof-type HAD-IIB family hydrolase [Lachnospiraceae bacterium]